MCRYPTTVTKKKKYSYNYLRLNVSSLYNKKKTNIYIVFQFMLK